MPKNTSTPDTTLTVRVNSTVKAAAQDTFRELGLDLSTAINIFLRQVGQNRSLPFPITLTPGQTNTTPITLAVTSSATPSATPTNTNNISDNDSSHTKTSGDDLSGAARLLDDPENAPLGEPFDFTR